MLEPHIAPPACVTEDAFAALMEISKRPPVVFVEGRGSWLTDQEGKKYLSRGRESTGGAAGDRMSVAAIRHFLDLIDIPPRELSGITRRAAP